MAAILCYMANPFRNKNQNKEIYISVTFALPP
jgi:hypothetical protein